MQKKNSATIKSSKTPVKLIHEIKAVNEKSLPKLEVPIKIQGQTCTMELETATNGNFISKQPWKDLGSPNLQKPDLHYESASKRMEAGKPHNFVNLGLQWFLSRRLCSQDKRSQRSVGIILSQSTINWRIIDIR